MKRVFHCKENTSGYSLAIRFRESPHGFSFTTLRAIVNSKAIDIDGWLRVIATKIKEIVATVESSILLILFQLEGLGK